MQQTQPQNDARLLTAQQAATYLGCSYSTVRRLAFAGDLPVVRAFGNGWRVDRFDLDALIERAKVVKPGIYKKY